VAGGNVPQSIIKHYSYVDMVLYTFKVIFLISPLFKATLCMSNAVANE
jgi:hypothetical protein